MSDKKKLDNLKSDALNTSEVKGGKGAAFSKASSGSTLRTANSVHEVEDVQLKDKSPHFKGDIQSMEEMKSRRERP